MCLRVCLCLCVFSGCLPVSLHAGLNKALLTAGVKLNTLLSERLGQLIHEGNAMFSVTAASVLSRDIQVYWDWVKYCSVCCGFLE